jgi:hypothetical protein
VPPMRSGFFGAAPERKPVQPIQSHSREGENTEHRAPRVDLSIHEFDVGEELGEGSFSHVLSVTRKCTNERYASRHVNGTVASRMQRATPRSSDPNRV